MKFGFKRKIGLELLIEEVEGIANVNTIAVSSPRIESLMFGLGDYTRSQGVDFREAFGANRTYVGDVWHYQRHAISVAAHVARVDYVDGPWPRIPDMDGFRRECHFARTVGAVGKWAIHPSQIPIATEAFSPTAQQIEIASRNIALIHAAQARGEGAIKSPEGGLLDIAAVPLLQQVLDKAKFYGLPVPTHP
jgi:citrate lyase subunit beta/citryl-CoA lyase